jgi:hypothetical protein
MKLKVLIFVAIAGFAGCYYDNEEELYPTNTCATDNMSFKNDVNTIFTNSGCMGCHSAAANLGNVNLSTHTEVLKYVNDGSLIGCLKHTAPFSPMPQGGSKLGNCAISKIEAWIAQGSKDN